MRRTRSIGVVLLLATLLVAASACGRAPATASGEWPVNGGTPLEQRFSPLGRIDRDNVKQLGLAWAAEFDSNRGQEATPLVVDGVMYVSTAWSRVYAFDAATGRQLWRYDPGVTGRQAFAACCDVVNRGVAVDRDRVFLGTIDGRLVALDARTGKPSWSVQTTDTSKPYTITGAPRVAGDKVVIGNAGADLGVRGYVTAYDVATGRQAWRFYTVPGDPKGPPDGAASDGILKTVALPTWAGHWYEYGGGGTVWDAIVYDPELKQLYIGVGNGSPWNRQIRSDGRGDNLFLSSVVALDPETGAYRWHYQETPGESWDFTATQPIILATLKIDGRDRKVLMQAPKNGFFYVLDRTNGKLISAKNYVPVNWASGVDMATGRPIENAAARYLKAASVVFPTAGGGHNWNPMAFSPKTGLVYIPAQELAMPYGADKAFKYGAGDINTGTDLSLLAPPDDPAVLKRLSGLGKGRLIAWDPVAQKPRWSVTHATVQNGGVLATAGNLIFQGVGGSRFEARAADTGQLLWNYPAQSGVMAGPISYEVRGVQYIAVLDGYGGGHGLSTPADQPAMRPNGRVLAFKLGGKATLPAAVATTPLPLQAPGDHFTDAQVSDGRMLFARRCGRCHGAGAQSAGVTPDLRRSPALSDAALWRSIVMDGAREQAGMVSFASWLTPAQAESVRAYVALKARIAQAAQP